MQFLKKIVQRFVPKPKDRPLTLAELSYAMAYRVLPGYAFDESHDLKMWSVTKACGPYFYLLTLGLAYGKPPEECDPELGMKFQWHTGQLQDGRTYFAMEYPLTPEHSQNLSEAAFLKDSMAGKCTLPPYFSAMIGRVDEAGGTFHDVRYFILGKSPQPDCTTWREMTADGANINQGMGPAPKLESFLERLAAT